MGLGYLTLGEETPSLSGGEAQRLKLASEMGKSQSDAVFIFDEPTIGLHPLDVRTLLDVFQQINQTGQTLLMVTHSLKAASRAGRILFIRDGQVYHQLYRGEMTNEQFYEKISDALTVMTRKDAMDGEMA